MFERSALVESVESLTRDTPQVLTIAASFAIFPSAGGFTAGHALGLAAALGGMTGSALRESAAKGGGADSKALTPTPASSAGKGLLASSSAGGGSSAALLPVVGGPPPPPLPECDDDEGGDCHDALGHSVAFAPVARLPLLRHPSGPSCEPAADERGGAEEGGAQPRLQVRRAPFSFGSLRGAEQV